MADLDPGARDRAVAKILAPLPRAIAHSIKDALEAAYAAGWEDGRKDAGRTASQGS